MPLKVKLRQQLFPKILDFEANFSAQVTGLCGPTGAGKSTILNAIAGIRRADFSQITFEGEIWSDSKKNGFVRPQARRLAYVMQEIALFPNLTVQQNIEFSRNCKARHLGLNSEELAVLANRLELTGYLSKSVLSLSGGQKQRVALARALYSRPRLLLLDEPFNGLDDEAVRQAIQLVAEMIARQNTQTIIVSHRRHELEQLADEIIVLK